MGQQYPERPEHAGLADAVLTDDESEARIELDGGAARESAVLLDSEASSGSCGFLHLNLPGHRSGDQGGTALLEQGDGTLCR